MFKKNFVIITLFWIQTTPLCVCIYRSKLDDGEEEFGSFFVREIHGGVVIQIYTMRYIIPKSPSLFIFNFLSIRRSFVFQIYKEKGGEKKK